MAILRYQHNGEWVEIPVIKGKSAYESYIQYGGSLSEEEFNELLGDLDTTIASVKEQGNYAEEQGDYAKEQADNIIELLDSKIDKEAIAQGPGDSEVFVMSQKAVTELIGEGGSGTGGSGSINYAFTSIDANSGELQLDLSILRNMDIQLSGVAPLITLHLLNVATNETKSGIIILRQSGNKQVEFIGDVVGSVQLPKNAGTILRIDYIVRNGQFVISNSVVVGDLILLPPPRITDLDFIYKDNKTVSLQFSAPQAHTPGQAVTYYDIRYANNPINPEDLKAWNSISRLNGPTPASPGTIQTYNITNLSPNMEYYFYIKSVKVTEGIPYISEASDPLYVRTLGAHEIERPFKLTINPSTIYTSDNKISMDPGTTPPTYGHIKHLVDEDELDLYLDNGYIDTSNRDYTSYYMTGDKYARRTFENELIIDLLAPYTLDKLFFYVKTKTFCACYGMPELGGSWVSYGRINLDGHGWDTINFNNSTVRFIKFVWDTDEYGQNQVRDGRTVEVGEEVWHDGNLGGFSLERIYCIRVYGRPVISRPELIKPPRRRGIPKKDFYEFFATNAHAYQIGRPHALAGGKNVRMYMNFGQFAHHSDGTGSGLALVPRIADLKFRLNYVDWIRVNSGVNLYLEDHLREHWYKYGLTPFLGNTDVFDCVRAPGKNPQDVPLYTLLNTPEGQALRVKRDGGKSNTDNRQIDDYFLPNVWRPIPVRGVGGTAVFRQHTTNPLSYRVISKLCYNIAAKYGNVVHVQEDMHIHFSGGRPETESYASGLKYIQGIEVENEADKTWWGFPAYETPEEFAALMSAVYDGHMGQAKDEDNVTKYYGIKQADPNMKVISMGTAGVVLGYWLRALLWWKSNRTDGKVPFDVASVHQYYSNIGTDQAAASGSIHFAVPVEEGVLSPEGSHLLQLSELRDRYFPDKEIWITEFGYGECGAPNTRSRYQCYTQPGRVVGAWSIPDLHRSEVKAAWTIRGCLKFMEEGIDLINYYSTESETNWFHTGQYGNGAGYEMFEWDKLTDNTPGIKAQQIKPHEVPWERGGFSGMGLFGKFIQNGGYPISRAFWPIQMFRRRLKDYKMIGRKYLSDSKIIVYCFKKDNEDKGAYVIYYNDKINTGAANISIPLPSGISQVKKIKRYIPKLPDPRTVPENYGTDYNRTGFATTTKTEVDGVIQVSFPTQEQNPWFPIVGPVNGWSEMNGGLASDQYLQQTGVDGNGVPTFEVASDARLYHRQLDALCDYIEYHPEGIRGTWGDEEISNTQPGNMIINVGEFPDIYLFDKTPDPDFKSYIDTTTAVVINPTTVEIWWNNNNPYDTHYEIFSSSMPETGYTSLSLITAGLENKTTVSGLTPGNAYYFKVRAICNGKAGEFSNYSSVVLPPIIEAPTNLRVGGRTASSIELLWDYVSTPNPDFLYYSVDRAVAGGFINIGKVFGQITKRFVDEDCPTGVSVRYRVSVVTNFGKSSFTEEITAVTLLPEQVSPRLINSYTNKIGTRITLRFDLPIGAITPQFKNNLALLENGVAKLIASVELDTSDNRNILLGIYQGTLADYDQYRNATISYNGNGLLTSIYGILLAPFSGTILNSIGNFSDIENTYLINLCSNTDFTVDDPKWNNLYGTPNLNEVVLNNLVTDQLVTTNITIKSLRNNTTIPKTAWAGTFENLGIQCTVPNIPGKVIESGWSTAVNAYLNEETVSRLQVANIHPLKKYNVKAFCSMPTGKRRVKMKVNGLYSNTVEMGGNKNHLLLLEGISANNDGVLNIDIIPYTESPDFGVARLVFLIIEESNLPGTPSNTDVHIWDVIPTGGTTTTSSAISGVINYYGIPTHYRIHDQEITQGTWVPMTDNIFHYNMSLPFGPKTLLFQIKNQFIESLIYGLNMSYIDPNNVLELNNVIINNDNPSTFSNTVSVELVTTGTPTHYRIGALADLSDSVWQPFTPSFDYTLPSSFGTHLLYIQIKNNSTESSILNRNITYLNSQIVLTSLVLSAGGNTTANSDIFIIPQYSGIVAEYLVSDDANFSGASWNAFDSNIPFTLSTYGIHTIYVRLRNTEESSNVLSLQVTYSNAVLLTSIVANNGDLTTVLNEVPVMFNYTGSPTHYRIGEQPTLEGVTWLPFSSNPITYTLSEGYGVKTLYGQLKNATDESIISTTTVDKIMPILDTVVLSFTGSNNVITYPIHNEETLNVYDPRDIRTTWVPVQFKNTFGDNLNWFGEKHTDYYPITDYTNVTGSYLTGRSTNMTDNTGPYPSTYLSMASCLHFTGESNTKKGRIVFSLPAGIYTFKMLMCVGNDQALNPTELANSKYQFIVDGIAQEVIPVGPSGFTGLHNKEFNAETTVTVTSNNPGNVVFLLLNTSSHGYRPGITMMKIIKLD